MYTRCPHCDTYFRVTREQLQISSGQVRCGRCERVFDAFATLSAQLPAPPPSLEGVVSGDAPGSESARASEAGRRTEPPDLDVHGATLGQGDRPAPSASDAPGATEPQVLTLPDNLFGPAAQRASAGRRWPWAVASIVLVMGLFGQALFFLGTDLAVWVPELRPTLIEACSWLGCAVALPRLPDQLYIEASDLQVLNATRPNEVLLTATIRNRAAVAQEVPLIELTLTDKLNQAAARKVFYPSEYLDKSQDPEQGVGPSQEIAVKLYLDTGDIRPAGYRLYLFFA